MISETTFALEHQYRRLVDLGLSLSTERNRERLLDLILRGAKDIANAEGGTLYMLSPAEQALHFTIVINDVLKVGGDPTQLPPLAPIPLYHPDGSPNDRNICSSAATRRAVIVIDDIYSQFDYDFAGARAFDSKTGYHTHSLLAVPMHNHAGDVIGVLQLINARDASGRVGAFTPDTIPIIEVLASQAAVALDNHGLLAGRRDLFRAFIEVIANAIDAKSPYTGGHCRRVPTITNLLAEAAVNAKDGPLADFTLSPEDFYALDIASCLHDAGKVTTREYVIDKATKLETVNNRIHEIRTRFEVLKRDVEIEYLRGCLCGGDEPTIRRQRDQALTNLDDDFVFVAACNVGDRPVTPDMADRLRQIGAQEWQPTIDDRLGLSRDERNRRGEEVVSAPVPLLSDRPDHVIPFNEGLNVNNGELYNLTIRAGTLNAEERQHVNDHIVQTIAMLRQLPFTGDLRHVTDWAGSHHERVDGRGYPRGLTGQQMDVPARIMAIADIFEALTAADRPYKPYKTLSQAVAIMADMTRTGHIDQDLFILFLRSGVHLHYAEKYLLPHQIDAVDIDAVVALVTGPRPL